MFGTDERGQAIQVGAVILFSFVVIGLSMYQATVVPDQNAEVEFNHNQEVQRDMVELRNGIISSGASGRGTVVAVQLGTTYPARAIAINPGPPSGSLRTVAPSGGRTLTVKNAEALDAETGDFWDGSDQTYSTTGVQYEPNYNEFRAAPVTVYENSIVYNRGPDGGIAVLTEQQLVDGRELDLTLLQGTYEASQAGTVSADVSSESGQVRTVLVQRSSPGMPIEFSFPSDLSVATWKRLLSEELNGGFVTRVSKSGAEVTVKLQGNDADGDPISYRLTLPAAGLGTDIPETTPTYMTDVSGSTSVPEGGTRKFVAEVRNSFDGPESGVKTSASMDGTFGSDSVTCSTRTDEKGRVSCEYAAPNNVNSLTTVEVTVQFDDGSPDTEVATFEIDVQNSDGSGGGPQQGNFLKIDDGNTNTKPKAVDASANGVYSAAEFGLVNTDPNQQITSISTISIDISKKGKKPDKLERQGTNIEEYDVPVYTTGNSQAGYINAQTVALDTTADFDQKPDIDTDSGILVHLNQFQKNNGDEIDMKGAELTVTVEYVVNGQKYTETETFTLSDTTTV